MHESAFKISWNFTYFCQFIKNPPKVLEFLENMSKNCQHLFSLAIYNAVCHYPGKSDIWSPLSSFCKGHWISGITCAHACNYILCGHVFAPKCCRLILPRAFIILFKIISCAISFQLPSDYRLNSRLFLCLPHFHLLVRVTFLAF